MFSSMQAFTGMFSDIYNNITYFSKYKVYLSFPVA